MFSLRRCWFTLNNAGRHTIHCFPLLIGNVWGGGGGVETYEKEKTQKAKPKVAARKKNAYQRSRVPSRSLQHAVCFQRFQYTRERGVLWPRFQIIGVADWPRHVVYQQPGGICSFQSGYPGHLSLVKRKQTRAFVLLICRLVYSTSPDKKRRPRKPSGGI